MSKRSVSKRHPSAISYQPSQPQPIVQPVAPELTLEQKMAKYQLESRQDMIKEYYDILNRSTTTSENKAQARAEINRLQAMSDSDFMKMKIKSYEQNEAFRRQVAKTKANIANQQYETAMGERRQAEWQKSQPLTTAQVEAYKKDFYAQQEAYNKQQIQQNLASEFGQALARKEQATQQSTWNKEVSQWAKTNAQEESYNAEVRRAYLLGVAPPTQEQFASGKYELEQQTKIATFPLAVTPKPMTSADMQNAYDWSDVGLKKFTYAIIPPESEVQKIFTTPITVKDKYGIPLTTTVSNVSQRLLGLTPSKPVEEFMIGGIVGLREKPSETLMNIGIGFAIPPVLKGAGLLGKASGIIKWGASRPMWSQPAVAFSKAIPIAITGAYGADIYGRVSEAKSPSRELGSIFSTEIVPFGLGWGTAEKLMAKPILKEKALFKMEKGRGSEFMKSFDKPLLKEPVNLVQRANFYKRLALIESAKPELTLKIRNIKSGILSRKPSKIMELYKPSEKITSGIKLLETSTPKPRKLELIDFKRTTSVNRNLFYKIGKRGGIEKPQYRFTEKVTSGTRLLDRKIEPPRLLTEREKYDMFNKFGSRPFEKAVSTAKPKAKLELIDFNAPSKPFPRYKLEKWGSKEHLFDVVERVPKPKAEARADLLKNFPIQQKETVLIDFNQALKPLPRYRAERFGSKEKIFDIVEKAPITKAKAPVKSDILRMFPSDKHITFESRPKMINFGKPSKPFPRIKTLSDIIGKTAKKEGIVSGRQMLEMKPLTEAKEPMFKLLEAPPKFKPKKSLFKELGIKDLGKKAKIELKKTKVREKKLQMTDMLKIGKTKRLVSVLQEPRTSRRFIYVPSSKSLIDTSSMSMTLQKPVQKSAQESAQEQKSAQESAQEQRSDQQQRQRQKEKQKQEEKQKEDQQQKEKTRERLKEEQKRIEKLQQENKEKKKMFILTHPKSYQLSVQEKGKFMTIGKPMARQSALDLGTELVDQTPSAQFKIVGSNRKSSANSNVRHGYFDSNRYKLRPYKVRSRVRIPMTEQYIEKTAHRIDSKGEHEGITVKGWLAKKRKAIIRKTGIFSNKKRGRLF